MDRSELEDRVRKLVQACPGGLEETCPFCQCSCDTDVSTAMELIDTYTAAAVDRASGQPTGEVWDAWRCAKELDLVSDASARSVLSQNKIKAASHAKDPETGRLKSYYPASQVRALRVVLGIRKGSDD